MRVIAQRRRRRGVDQATDAVDLASTTSSPALTLTTPSGVPVRIRSPGFSVMKRLRYSISAATSNGSCSRVLPCCVTLPLTRVRRRRACGSGTSAAVDQPGAEHGAAVAVLHAQVRAVPVLEVVAHRVVVGHACSRRHGPKRRPPSRAARRAADDHRQLAFVVHEGDVARARRAAAVADQRSRPLQEGQRLVLAPRRWKAPRSAPSHGRRSSGRAR